MLCWRDSVQATVLGKRRLVGMDSLVASLAAGTATYSQDDIAEVDTVADIEEGNIQMLVRHTASLVLDRMVIVCRVS